jgi:hypothetical protein
MKRQVESINPNGIYVPGTDIGNRGKTHVVNLETIDNHKAAKEGSEHALYLLERVCFLMIIFTAYLIFILAIRK